MVYALKMALDGLSILQIVTYPEVFYYQSLIRDYVLHQPYSIR